MNPVKLIGAEEWPSHELFKGELLKSDGSHRTANNGSIAVDRTTEIIPIPKEILNLTVGAEELL